MEPARRTLRQRAILWGNRARFDVRLKLVGFWPQIVLHERFRRIASSLKWALTGIGLLSAFVAFESVWIAFTFGAVVWAVTTVIERIVFSYNSLFVHALPGFKLEPEKWLGAVFGYAQGPDNPHQIPVVGWIMADAKYARSVHRLLLRWSYGVLRDEGQNISASVVVLSERDYIFFCYPSIDRTTAQAFFDEIEQERRKASLSDVHHKQMAMLIFGKRCQITSASYFPTFRKRYKDGVPYLFQFVVLGPDGNPTPIPELEDFILFNLKIKDQANLDRKDIEYDLVRVLST